MATRKVQDIDAAEISAPVDGGFVQDGMFVFDATPTIRNWPVRIKYPTGPATFETHQVRFDFMCIDVQTYNQLGLDLQKYVLAGGKPGGEGDPLLPWVVGWSGIKSKSSGAVPFSVENRSKLMANGRLRQAVIEALLRMANGIEEKNFETSPAAGQPQQEPNRKGRRAAAAKQRKAAATA